MSSTRSLRESIRAGWGFPRTAPSEAAFVEMELDRVFVETYRRSTAVGAVASVLMVGVCGLYSGTRWGKIGIVTGVVLAGALFAFRAFDRRRPAGPRLVTAFLVVPGVLGAIAIGVSAAETRGLSSVGAIVLLLFWLFACAMVKTRFTVLAVAMGVELVAFSAPAVMLHSTQGAATFAVVAIGGGLLLLAGTRLREATDARALVAQLRLRRARAEIRAANRRLEWHTRELAIRVDDQLRQIVTKRREIDRLKALVVEQRPIRRLPSVPSISAPSTKLGPGVVLGGRAEIERQLASGGFGDVFAAVELTTGEPVVAKVLRVDEDTSASHVRRFVLEAAAAAAVRHPAIVRILDVDVADDGSPFLLYERLRGVTLGFCIDLVALPVRVALPVFSVVADALQAVHARGVVHRDVKPDNIMLVNGHPGVKLIDFGLAYWEANAVNLTDADEMLGTVGYMAPEVLRHGRSIDPAQDVYSLGMSLYEALLGRHPLHGRSVPEIVALHRRALPPLSSIVPAISPAVSDLVEAMTASSPHDRPSMAAAASGLRVLGDAARGIDPAGALALLCPDAVEGAGRAADALQVTVSVRPPPGVV